MNNDLVENLLSDPDVVELLEEMILEKYERYEKLATKWNGFEREQLEALFEGDVTYKVVNTAFYHYMESKEIKMLERDLNGMSYVLSRSRGDVPTETEWQKQYDYATKQVCIDNVVACYTGAENLKRNISF